MMMFLNVLIVVFITALHIEPCFADYEKAYAAYEAGDHKEALAEWHIDAEKGDVFAQVTIASMYSEGEGVKQDDATAFKWFHRAADLGNAYAQRMVGVYYLSNKVTEKNDKLALYWFKRAAMSGEAEHEYFYGFIYDFGRLVPQDYKEASIWYERAADKGHAKAAALLGRVYLEGSILDFENFNFNAFVWSQLALSLGYEQELVRDNLIRCEKYLSTEEKEEAMEIVRKKLTQIKHAGGKL